MYHSLVRHKHYSIKNNNLVGFFRFSFFPEFWKNKTKQKCTQKHNLTCLQVFEHWSATWIFKVNFALRKIVSGDATQPTDASYALWKKAYYILFKNLAFNFFFPSVISDFNSWHKMAIFIQISPVQNQLLVLIFWYFPRSHLIFQPLG